MEAAGQLVFPLVFKTMLAALVVGRFDSYTLPPK